MFIVYIVVLCICIDGCHVIYDLHVAANSVVFCASKSELTIQACDIQLHSCGLIKLIYNSTAKNRKFERSRANICLILQIFDIVMEFSGPLIIFVFILATVVSR